MYEKLSQRKIKSQCNENQTNEQNVDCYFRRYAATAQLSTAFDVQNSFQGNLDDPG